MPSRTERNYKPRSPEDRPAHPAERVINIVFLLGATACFFLWLVPQVRVLVNGGIGTTVAVTPQAVVDFPAITICNMEAGVPVTFQACTDPEGKDCFGARRDDTGNFTCTTFNYDYETPLATTASGLRSLLTVQGVINKNLYAATSLLYGVQVVLHEPGTAPDVEANGIFVAPGQATIITLRRTQTNHLPPPDGKGGYTLGWDASPSILSIDQGVFRADELFVVGFMYRELSVMTIDEIKLMTDTSFAGGLAGMIGVLFGLDVYNSAVLIVGAIFAYWARRKGGDNDVSAVAADGNGAGYGGDWSEGDPMLRGAASSAAAGRGPGDPPAKPRSYDHGHPDAPGSFQALAARDTDSGAQFVGGSPGHRFDNYGGAAGGRSDGGVTGGFARESNLADPGGASGGFGTERIPQRPHHSDPRAEPGRGPVSDLRAPTHGGPLDSIHSSGLNHVEPPSLGPRDASSLPPIHNSTVSSRLGGDGGPLPRVPIDGNGQHGRGGMDLPGSARDEYPAADARANFVRGGQF